MHIEIDKATPRQTYNLLIGLGVMYVEDRFVDQAGPYILAEDLHAVGRMNGLGAYVKTRDSFVQVPRISYEDWQKGKR